MCGGGGGGVGRGGESSIIDGRYAFLTFRKHILILLPLVDWSVLWYGVFVNLIGFTSYSRIVKYIGPELTRRNIDLGALCRAWTLTIPLQYFVALISHFIYGITFTERFNLITVYVHPAFDVDICRHIVFFFAMPVNSVKYADWFLLYNSIKFAEFIKRATTSRVDSGR